MMTPPIVTRAEPGHAEIKVCWAEAVPFAVVVPVSALWQTTLPAS